MANFVPEEAAQFLLIQSDGTVGYDNASVLDNIATGPTNLFFYGASTKCYKTVGNITYLLPNCSRDLLNDTYAQLHSIHIIKQLASTRLLHTLTPTHTHSHTTVFRSSQAFSVD